MIILGGYTITIGAITGGDNRIKDFSQFFGEHTPLLSIKKIGAILCNKIRGRNLVFVELLRYE